LEKKTNRGGIKILSPPSREKHAKKAMSNKRQCLPANADDGDNETIWPDLLPLPSSSPNNIKLIRFNGHHRGKDDHHLHPTISSTTIEPEGEMHPRTTAGWEDIDDTIEFLLKD
jgi:hypothetical protein